MSSLTQVCYTDRVIWRGMRTKGYTLIEILVALALLGLAFAMLIGSLQNFRSNRGVVRGDAEILAELLRSLRQQAITQHRPVGLGIPSNNRSAASANGYYVLEGEVRPKVVRSVVLKQGQAGQLTAGYWAGPAFTGSPATSFTGSQYTLTTWEPPYPNDGLIMFLPSGEVLTNLPTFQGQVAVVMARSLQANWTSLSSQPCVQITQAQLPMVIWCSILGEIRIEPGLPGSTGIVTSTPVAGGGVAVPPPLTSDTNVAPRFVSPMTAGPLLEVSPPPNGNTLSHVASGQTGTLGLDRYLSLKVAATDANGDQLWCRWSCTGPQPNSFTKQGEVRMVYNPRARHWESTFAWHVREPNPAEVYRLEATISDRRGGQTLLSSQLTSGGRFQILRPGRLAFTRGNDTWTSNWDGTDPVIVKKDRVAPRWSDDGDYLVVRDANATKMYLLSPDGRYESTIMDQSGWTYMSPGDWRPGESQVGIVRHDGTRADVVLADAWSTNAIDDTWGGASWTGTEFAPTSKPVLDFNDDGDTLVVSGDTPGLIYVMTEDGLQTVKDAAGVDVQGCEAAWNGSNLVFKNATGGIEIWNVTVAGAGTATPSMTLTTQQHIATGVSNARGPRLSHDSTNYAVVEGDDGAGRNCFLLWGNGSLGSPLKIFNFDARQPDWSSQ